MVGLNSIEGNAITSAHIGKAQKPTTGLLKQWVEVRIRISILKIVLNATRRPARVLHILGQLDTLRRKILGENRIKKIVKVDGKYYWDMYVPGWNSVSFARFFEGEINRIAPVKASSNRFSNIFLAITKKCALRCEHCFEWENLNGKERLSLSDLTTIVDRFQSKGVAQIYLTGGEPMQRLGDMLTLMKTAKSGTDLWLLTSGLNLTAPHAVSLKEAGLIGVVISLDHYVAEEHNRFRGFKDAWFWATTAVKNALEANLVVVLSICVTRTFSNETDLMHYMTLAKELGVSFVQILEPKPVGHYAGQDVLLQSNELRIVDEFSRKMNYDKRYSAYPIVIYHGAYQREIGCFAAGNRNLYIDTDGDIHACPFCRTAVGSTLTDDIDVVLDRLQQKGCHSFTVVK